MTDCKNCKYTDEYCASGECTIGNNNLYDKIIVKNYSDLSLAEQFEKGAVVKVDDELAKVKQQLKIAVKALGKYANKNNWQNHYTIDLNDWELELTVFNDGEVDDGEFYAQEALQQIKDLEK